MPDAMILAAKYGTGSAYSLRLGNANMAMLARQHLFGAAGLPRPSRFILLKQNKTDISEFRNNRCNHQQTQSQPHQPAHPLLLPKFLLMPQTHVRLRRIANSEMQQRP
jgi:cytochrome b